MGALADLLRGEPAQQPQEPDEQDGRALAALIEGPHDASDYGAILESCGHDPSQVGFAAPPSVYTRWKADGTQATTYRYKLIAKRESSVEPLIERIKAAPKRVADGSTGPHWFVFQAGDQQIGKRSRDGSTAEIIERYLDSVQQATEEFADLKRHGIEGIQISMPGDCLEGVVSQSSKNLWLTQETITEQFRILRRLMLHTVEAFAPLTDRVYLDVVNGNHDEAQREQNTYPGDGWATESAIAVADALEINKAAYGHVEVRTPDKWCPDMTNEVGSSLVTVVHGHQWRIGKGMAWWQEQAFGNQPAASAQVLQHGHGHRWELETTRDRVRVASPTYDCGSDWYRGAHGGESKRGGLAYLLKNGEISRMSLV
ncbi:hypothetical protein [Antrihabitans cavernicola]|uniref:Exonuclease n=1 Tax=Antrihabitans cavernicola TaxID=2495913 RepID=A0A5A7S7E3_9NOCA|nr:hypothetical protein [Spelaeibacter cavernicola]KAA0021816.1 hypothetical protein FOY51_15550 [Spelaeibacter cavernicola]